MKKRMERLDDKLFQPLAEAEQSRITGGLIKDPPQTSTAITIFETYDPAPDWSRDGDNE
jgi:hypothetical protein